MGGEVGTSTKAEIPTGNNALTCDTNVKVLEITPVDVWTDLVNNITRFDEPAKEALPYCEEAVNDYVALGSNCKEFSQQTTIEQDSFYSNCDNCNNPFAPFTFSVQARRSATASASTSGTATWPSAPVVQAAARRCLRTPPTARPMRSG